MKTLYRLLSLAALLLLPLSSAFAASAYVHELAGTMTAQYGSGPSRPLKVGDTLDAGVRLATGDKTSAVVKFEDGQVIVLQSNTQFVVREYQYNTKSVKDSNVFFALLRGGARFVTGVIGATNRNAFRVSAGTATIGVRGTDVSIVLDQSVVQAVVNNGSISFTTAEGTINLNPGDFGSYTPGTAPVIADLAKTSAVVQAVTKALQAQGIPTTDPIVVESAARAAASAAVASALQAAAKANPNNEQLQKDAKAATDAAVAAATQAASDAAKAAGIAVQAGGVVTVSTTTAVTTTTPTGQTTTTTTIQGGGASVK